MSENNCCCLCLDYFDNLWENNKYKISSKLSISLGLLSGASSILLSLGLIIPASISSGLCSVGIFFAGVALTKFENQNEKLLSDVESLKEEKRRFTTFQFPYNTPIISITPKSDASCETEPFQEVVDIGKKFESIKD